MAKEILFTKPVNAETIEELIEACKGEKEVTLLMDCGNGGDPYSAIAFHSFVRTYGIKLEVNVIARCVSAGIFILCAGQVRKASKHGLFLIHQNDRTFSGSLNLKEMEWQLNSMKKLKESLLSIISAATGKPRDELEKLYDKESELTAQQAFELGLLTEKPY